MVTRRTLLAGSLAAPFALVLGGRRAVAAPGPAVGAVHAGAVVAKAGRGTRPLRMRRGHARLGAVVAPRGVAVFSISNANDLYVALVETPTVPTADTFLIVKRGVVRSESYGTGFSGHGGGAVTFQLDLALADEVARAWGVSRRDRVPLGAGLSGQFRPKAQPFVAGKPMAMVLELTNAGPTSVWFNVGGRQRGARDNRFGFEVRVGGPGGAVVPAIDAPDFGGVGAVEELKPGATRGVTADLASWAALTAPGPYAVTCRYELELEASAAGTAWPDHGGESWDFAATEVIDVVVT